MQVYFLPPPFQGGEPRRGLQTSTGGGKNLTPFQAMMSDSVKEIAKDISASSKGGRETKCQRTSALQKYIIWRSSESLS